MVNWQTPDADLRLCAAIFAASPGLNPNSSTIATLYGRGATNHAVHHQVVKVRKLARELTAEAEKRGAQVPPATPRANRAPRAPQTPRTQSTGKSKTSSVCSQLRRKLFAKTPSKAGKSPSTQQGQSVVDPISVDSDNDSEDESVSSDDKSVKSEVTVPGDEQLIKEERKDRKAAEVLKSEPGFIVPPFPQDENLGIGRVQPRVNSQTNGYAGAALPSMQNAASGYDVYERYDVLDDIA